MAMKKQTGPGNLTKNASQPKRGGDYSKEAHTERAHMHTKDGQVFGKPNDSAPMDYVRKTQAEGATNQPVAGGIGGRGNIGMAEHHAAPNNLSGSGHLVGSLTYPAKGADGYGHAAHQRSGVLRTSGHKGAHRVGKR